MNGNRTRRGSTKQVDGNEMQVSPDGNSMYESILTSFETHFKVNLCVSIQNHLTSVEISIDYRECRASYASCIDEKDVKEAIKRLSRYVSFLW